MKRSFLFLSLLALFVCPTIVNAQSNGDTLPLVFSRDFGYGAGNQIQGTFSLKVKDYEDLERVDYLFDDRVVFSSTEPPFRFQFNTAQFGEGIHSIYAIGTKTDGSTIQSNKITREFISSTEAYSNVGKFIIPLLAIVGIISLGGVMLPLVFGRKKTHQPGVYGAAGGAVCPKCGLPFSRSIFAPNLLIGKLQRCPHCGKWSIVPRASKQALADAELRLASDGKIDINKSTGKDEVRQMIEDSRFEE
ncbi:MAG TPA: hypothetical protein G4N95_09450 [Anaerolineae bacterium]|nr:hypothetical protein [Anaerolineae bacterium]